jgi:hypothetical protein
MCLKTTKFIREEKLLWQTQTWQIQMTADYDVTGVQQAKGTN